MSSYELRALESSLSSLLASSLSYIIAAVLSSLLLNYAIRWFIFKRAGEKGWKALIPFYSDFTMYKICWDGRMYITLLVVQIAATILSAIFGAINPAFGTVMGVILNTASMGLAAVVGIILNFKLAHAFGRGDYFAVGLSFLGSVFTTILAFGSDVEYQGPQKDGFGVPDFINQAGQRATSAAANAASRIAQQAQQAKQATMNHVQQMAQQQQQQQAQQPNPYQPPQQPQQPQQNNYYGVQQPTYNAQPQQPQAPQYGGYPTQPSAPQLPSRTARRSAPAQDPFAQDSFDDNLF